MPALRPILFPFLVGAVFMLLHLAFQVFSLLQSYSAAMAHFDDPLSRQAAWESRFWEKTTTVATFPLVRVWEHLPAAWRSNSLMEWSLLVGNSMLWAIIIVFAIWWVGEKIGGAGS